MLEWYLTVLITVTKRVGRDYSLMSWTNAIIFILSVKLCGVTSLLIIIFNKLGIATFMGKGGISSLQVCV